MRKIPHSLRKKPTQPNIVRIDRQKPKLVQKETLPAYLQKAQAEEQRFAGDALEQMADDIIGEIRDEAAYEDLDGIKDMVGALNQRDSQVAGRWDKALEVAGLNKSNLNLAGNINDNDIQLVGNISPLTPQAVEFDWAKDTVTNTWPDRKTTTDDVLTQTRLHSQFERNPLTGQLDVVPFLDTNTNTPLVTQFGRVGQSVHSSDVEGMDSDEFLGKRILQLMGTPVVRNNDGDKFAVDLINPKTGEKIDVEIGKKNNLLKDRTLAMQAYTEMAPKEIAVNRPTSGPNGQRFTIANQMAAELRPMLDSKMREGLSLEEAVNVLTREGKVSNSDGRFAPNQGKLLKEEGQYVDGIVTPVLTNKDAALNLATERQDGKRGLVMPLEGALLTDVSAVQKRLSEFGPEQVSVHPMPGNRGRFRPSGKVYVDVPLTDSAVQNVRLTDETVRQLFRKQKETSR